jgi:hypothetical protein
MRGKRAKQYRKLVCEQREQTTGNQADLPADVSVPTWVCRDRFYMQLRITDVLYSFGFRAPYQVLLDADIIQDAARLKYDRHPTLEARKLTAVQDELYRHVGEDTTRRHKAKYVDLWYLV